MLMKRRFEIRVCNAKIIFLFLNKKFVMDTQKNASFEHPKQMLKLMVKKIFTVLRFKILFTSIWTGETSIPRHYPLNKTSVALLKLLQN